MGQKHFFRVNEFESTLFRTAWEPNFKKCRHICRFLLEIGGIYFFSFLEPFDGLWHWLHHKNWQFVTGYIVYSSLGSFFIPLIMILFLYFKIFLTQRQMMAKKKKKVMICENFWESQSSASRGGRRQVPCGRGWISGEWGACRCPVDKVSQVYKFTIDKVSFHTFAIWQGILSYFSNVHQSSQSLPISPGNTYFSRLLCYEEKYKTAKKEISCIDLAQHSLQFAFLALG